MPSPFSLGLQNADRVFDGFADGVVTVGNAAMTTSQLAVEVAHGLSAAPDWCLISSSAAAAAAAEGISFELGATTITFNKVDTQAEATISYLAGNLS